MTVYNEINSKTEKGNNIRFYVENSTLFVQVGSSNFSVENVISSDDKSKNQTAKVICTKEDGTSISTTIVENAGIVSAMFYASKKNAILVSVDFNSFELTEDKKYGQPFYVRNDDWSENRLQFAYRYK